MSETFVVSCGIWPRESKFGCKPLILKRLLDEPNGALFIYGFFFYQQYYFQGKKKILIE